MFVRAADGYLQDVGIGVVIADKGGEIMIRILELPGLLVGLMQGEGNAAPLVLAFYRSPINYAAINMLHAEVFNYPECAVSFDKGEPHHADRRNGIPVFIYIAVG